MLKVIVNMYKMGFVTLISQLSAAIQLTSYSSDGSGCASVTHTPLSISIIHTTAVDAVSISFAFNSDEKQIIGCDIRNGLSFSLPFPNLWAADWRNARGNVELIPAILFYHSKIRLIPSYERKTPINILTCNASVNAQLLRNNERAMPCDELQITLSCLRHAVCMLDNEFWWFGNRSWVL